MRIYLIDGLMFLRSCADRSDFDECLFRIEKVEDPPNERIVAELENKVGGIAEAGAEPRK